MINFGIDIDGTYSLSPPLFRKIEKAIESFGGSVHYVTHREQPMDKRERLGLCGSAIHVVPAGVFKRDHMERIGIHIHVWIDNEPGFIEPQRILNHNASDEDL